MCRVHGCNCANPGGAPAGNKNAVKHGIYAVGLREDELAIWHEIPLGTLDDEIRLCRLQLRRALIAQAAAEREGADEAAALELGSVSHQKGLTAKGPVDVVTTARTRPDLRAEVYRLTGRIGELEAKRAAMPRSGESPADAARRIRDALFQMDESMNAADEAA